MKRKNFYAAVSSALTLGMVLTGCGGQTAETESANAPEEAVSANFQETGYPIVTEKETFSMMGSKAAIQGAWDSLVFFKDMEEKTNIAFTFDTPAAEVFEEKKNLALAGGSYPDVFFAANLTNAQQIKYGMDEKILIPLDGLIEKYAPNIQLMFEEHPEVKQSVTAPDGHIYALPNFNQGSLAKTPTWWYNGEWLEALGVTELPETTDEFYELLKRFKEEDPNGNGEADEIPFSFTTNANLDYLDPNLYILPAFGIGSARIYVEDGVVKYGGLEENFKEYLKYMRKLFEEGFIDPEWATQDDSTRIGKGKGNTIGIGSQAIPQNLYDVTDAEEAKKYPMAPALSSEFSSGEKHYLLYSQGITQGAFAITDKCSDPAAMIRWADYLYSEEGSFFIHYGREGELWKMAEDGSGLYEHITPEGGMSVEEYRGGVVTPDCGSTTPKWVRPSTVSDWVDPFQSVRIEQVDEKLLPYADVAFPSTFFMPDQQKRIDVIESDLNKYMEEMEAAFFTGTKDIDAEWDSFTETLKKMNVEELIGIYQESYDTWAGAK